MITILFLLVNSIKITFFNLFLTQNQDFYLFCYKFIFTLLCSIVIYPVLLTYKNKYAFSIFYIIQTVYILVNLSYFFYFHSYLQIIQWFSLFKEGFISTLHSSNPQNVKILIAFIDLPLAIYLAIFTIKHKIEFLNSKLIKRSSFIISVLLLLFIEISNFTEGYSLFHFIGNKYSHETEIVQRYGTLVNEALNIANNLSEEQLTRQITYGSSIAASSVTESRPNFVVIQVESLDANAVNTKYKDKYIAPYLHSLSENNVYYPYVLSYHKGGGTSDSEFSVINSIESLDDFPAMKLPNYDYPNSFVQRLSDNGYKTVAFHGNIGTFYNRNTAMPKMGFQEFYDIKEMGLENVGWGAPDSQVFGYANTVISNLDRPFISYIITMTSHGPFTNALNYYNNSNYDDVSDEVSKNYMNSISYVDQALQKFVTKLQETEENTYIIIFGDHTPNVESDTYKQASFTMDSRYFEFVPLLIVTPDKKQFQSNSEVASFMDIAPTILDASGIEFTLNSDGQDLLKHDNVKNNIPFREGSYDRKLLYDKISGTVNQN